MLNQKKGPHIKQHSRKDSIKTCYKNSQPQQGLFYIFSTEGGKINEKQSQTIEKVIKRISHRQIKVWQRLSLRRSVTKKPQSIRLGKGKGPVKYWNFIAKPGCLMYELQTTSSKKVQTTLKGLTSRLHVKTLLKYKSHRWVL